MTEAPVEGPATTPVVSVIVRSMDPPTLPRALDSIAAQDLAGVEVVLVAACGPSHRPIDTFYYPFSVTWVVPDDPMPRPVAANAGLDAASGEFVTMLDHDDEFLPGHLSALVGALRADPGAGGAYTRFEVYEHGQPAALVGVPFNRIELHRKSYLHHSALLWRRSLLATGLSYDTALDIHDDWDFVLQLAERARLVYVDRQSFRWHADTGTSGGGGAGNFDGEKYARQHAYVRDKWASIYNAHVAAYEAAMGEARAAVARGDFEGARPALARIERDLGDDPDALNLAAMVALRTQAPRVAVDCMERAVRQRPDDPDLWFNRGLACGADRMPGAARQCFERVLALDPAHAGARAWLAKLPAAPR